MNMFKPTNATTPEEYIAQIPEPRHGDIQKLHELIRETAPDLKPYIIAGMIGYGTYHYKYASGREGDWAPIGLASQKNYISVYLTCTSEGQYLVERDKAKFPKTDVGKSCIRFKKLDDIDQGALKKLIAEASISKEFAS